MFKRKITKAQYDAFAGEEAWKKNAYKVNPSNADEYLLDAEKDDGVADALNAKQHEVDEHRRTKEKLATVEAERDTHKSKAEGLEAEKRQGWKKDPDRDALEAEWKGKVTEAENKGKADTEAANTALRDYVRISRADAMASEISTMPKMLSREIADRMEVELVDGKPVVRILKDGKASVMTEADLKKEFVENEEYAPIIRASDARGGGAGATGKGGNGGAKPFKDMNEAERTTLYRTNPTEFRRLSAEHQQAAQGS